MSRKAVSRVKFYPEAPPPTEDDDLGELDTPVVVEFTAKFADRIYEEVCDGYMTLTEEEFQQMRRALNKAHKQRRPA